MLARGRSLPSTVFLATLRAGIPLSALAQGSGPIKNATSNPWQFDSGLGRSTRCATAGQAVSWDIHVDNPLGSDQIFGVFDPAPTPAGCFTFVGSPALSINGMPRPRFLPACMR